MAKTNTSASEPDPVVADPAPAAVTEPAPAVQEAGPAYLKGVKKGDQVRLLVPHYDGTQHLAADTVVYWWSDVPPLAENAARMDDPATPLTAPAMTDGKPPPGYIDPHTGKPIEPVAPIVAG